MKTSHGLGIKEYAGIEREGGSFFLIIFVISCI